MPFKKNEQLKKTVDLQENTKDNVAEHKNQDVAVEVENN